MPLSVHFKVSIASDYFNVTFPIQTDSHLGMWLQNNGKDGKIIEKYTDNGIITTWVMKAGATATFLWELYVVITVNYI